VLLQRSTNDPTNRHPTEERDVRICRPVATAGPSHTRSRAGSCRRAAASSESERTQRASARRPDCARAVRGRCRPSTAVGRRRSALSGETVGGARRRRADRSEGRRRPPAGSRHTPPAGNRFRSIPGGWRPR
jgi:hypothetical protein